MSHSFSIIIPTRGRNKELTRATKSILAQSYEDWELIIVNDGGPEPEHIEDPRIKYLYQERYNKAYARNLGMEAATKEWICWLDDDDAYAQCYLEVLNQQIDEFPEYKVFNFGGILYRSKGSREAPIFRDTIFREPYVIEDHQFFVAGKIATGHFVFHRDLLIDPEAGPIPKAINHYLFADMMKVRFPELMDHYGPLYMQGGEELGNPWGDDYAQFFILTRKYISKVLPFYLYIQYCRL
jgi:glycosyltransferase involved in cell wall biosynthesis